MKKILLLLVLVSLFFACDDSKDEEKEDLPIETIEWEDTEGYRRFYTNDPEKYDTAWFQYFTNSSNNELDSLEITLKKKSGCKTWGYGIMFSIQLNNNNEVEAYYRLFIDSTGSYTVQIYDGNNWITLIEWTHSYSLLEGYDKENKIRIEYMSGTYFIYFNDSIANSFSDSRLQSTDEFGFMTGIGTSDYEDFPNTPVDTYYKSSKPTTIPEGKRTENNSFKTGFGSIKIN